MKNEESGAEVSEKSEGRDAKSKNYLTSGTQNTVQRKKEQESWNTMEGVIKYKTHSSDETNEKWTMQAGYNTCSIWPIFHFKIGTHCLLRNFLSAETDQIISWQVDTGEKTRHATFLVLVAAWHKRVLVYLLYLNNTVNINVKPVKIFCACSNKLVLKTGSN